MADYKKKRRSRFKTVPKMNRKRIKENNFSSDIEMTPYDQKPKKQKMRVVKGKKLEQKRKFKGFVSAVGVLAALFIVLQLIMPAGVFETASNLISALGAGKYPIELTAGNTLNVVSKGSYYYVLTDTEIYSVSNSGKLMYSYTHGFEKPILKTSSTRALVFDQGKTEALIFNSKGLKSTVNSEKEIINADIGENGTYALITPDDNYTAAVRVYKKNGKPVYQWFSSDDMINNVAISGRGNKIAVSAISYGVGSYDSRLCVFGFKSANAEYTKDFKNTIIYELTSHGSGFSAVTQNSYNFITWGGKQITEYKNEYSADMFRHTVNGSVLVFNRESDKTDNRIVTFTNGGKLKTETNYKGVITDIAVKSNNVYCLNDTTLYILNEKGEILRNTQGGFGVKRMAVIGQNRVAAVTDNLISEIKLKQE